MEPLKVIQENLEHLSLPELYDLLAEETVKFNRVLLQKTSKVDLNELKHSVKQIQEEIQRRKAKLIP
ncbi:MAG TPA: hypothetical protein VEV87_05815 [Chitinophagaceae bacterium]|nr:hypothetical protein [Chitinophagaceae bacterium]